MSVPRVLRSILLTAAALVPLAACSSAPTENGGTNESDEALHICPVFGCGCMPKVHPTCWTEADTWANVPAPHFGVSAKWQAYGEHLKAEMIAAGCTAPEWYASCLDGTDGCVANEGLAWPTSSCPPTVPDDVKSLESDACDSCMPPLGAGWIRVSWRPGFGEPSGCSTPGHCSAN